MSGVGHLVSPHFVILVQHVLTKDRLRKRLPISLVSVRFFSDLDC